MRLVVPSPAAEPDPGPAVTVPIVHAGTPVPKAARLRPRRWPTLLSLLLHCGIAVAAVMLRPSDRDAAGGEDVVMVEFVPPGDADADRIAAAGPAAPPDAAPPDAAPAETLPDPQPPASDEMKAPEAVAAPAPETPPDPSPEPPPEPVVTAPPEPTTPQPLPAEPAPPEPTPAPANPVAAVTPEIPPPPVEPDPVEPPPREPLPAPVAETMPPAETAPPVTEPPPPERTPAEPAPPVAEPPPLASPPPEPKPEPEPTAKPVAAETPPDPPPPPPQRAVATPKPVVRPVPKPVVAPAPEARKMPPKVAQRTAVKAPEKPAVAGGHANGRPDSRDAADSRAGSAALRGSGLEGAAALASYKAQVLAHLIRHKRYPDAARERGTEGRVPVAFVVARDGRLVSAELVGSSGSPDLDRATLDTVRRAAPYPQAPDGAPATATFRTLVRYDLR